MTSQDTHLSNAMFMVSWRRICCTIKEVNAIIKTKITLITVLIEKAKILKVNNHCFFVIQEKRAFPICYS